MTTSAAGLVATRTARPTTLLGPQRLAPTLGASLAELGIDGRVATVTAGGQGREREDRELREHLGGRAVPLELNRRTDQLFARDPELRRAHRERQDELRHVQGLYRLRLDDLMHTVYALFRRATASRWLREDRQAAVDTVRELDRRHLERVRSIHAEFNARLRPAERDAVAAGRRAVAELVVETDAVAVAGGHVAVLLNRLRLFDLLGLAGDRPVVGWSAGAMVMAERVVLFHDSPPQGFGHAEVLEQGFGLVPDVVPLPHAHRRLALDDPVRVAVFARRFAPSACLQMADGARLDWDGGGAHLRHGLARLSEDGAVHEVGAR